MIKTLLLLLCLSALCCVGIAVVAFLAGDKLAASLWMFAAHLCLPFRSNS